MYYTSLVLMKISQSFPRIFTVCNKRGIFGEVSSMGSLALAVDPGQHTPHTSLMGVILQVQMYEN